MQQNRHGTFFRVTLFTVWQCSKVHAIMLFTFMHHIVINITQKYQIQSEIIMNFKLFVNFWRYKNCKVIHIQFGILSDIIWINLVQNKILMIHIPENHTWWGYIFFKNLDEIIYFSNIARIANAVQVTICLLVSTSVY